MRLDAVSKHFAGVRALHEVSLDLRPGEVHALAGENGAGKSTLIKIIGGLLQPDRGRMLVDGVAVQPRSAFAARRLGISVIYQDFDLVPGLSVADNLLLGQQPVYPMGFIRRTAGRKLVHDALARVGLDIDPRTPVAQITTAQRQLVAIARAVGRDCRVLVMDEPTSALAAHEITRLLELIRSLKRSGIAIIFISHKLDELFALADRITVLKDGERVASRSAAETTGSDLIRLMVGRDLAERFSRHPHPPGEVLLEACGVSSHPRFSDISFTLREGEIVGVYGLKGAGRTDLAEALFGLKPITRGKWYLRGHQVSIKSPRDAISQGIGRLPEDRKAMGVFENLDLESNMSLSALGTLSRFGFIRQRQEHRCVDDFIDKLNIRSAGRRQMISHLSGGNQQKVLLARWLMCQPDILILDEPTAGIDIGAKAEIYQFIDQLAAGGKAILLITSELPELLALSDRILVMNRGRITNELAGRQASEESVMEAIHAA